MPAGLASLLKQRGYRTAFFAAGDPEWGGMDYMAKKAGMDEVFGPNELGGRMASSWGTEDGIVVDGLLKWIDADRERPFFTVIWTDQTHDPYVLSADTKPIDFLDEKSVTNGVRLERYLNTIHQADYHLGRLFAHLRQRNIADDTLMIVTGDHGETFGNIHNVTGHGSSLFDEGLRVPLMMWNPRLFPSPRRSSQVGGHVDINPTLAHLMGIEPPPGWQGASLFSEDHCGRVYLLADMSDIEFGVREGRYKYMLYVNGGFERLYDLEEDPQEHHDVSAQHPDVTAQLRDRVSAFVHAEERYIKGLDPRTGHAPVLGVAR